MWEELANCLPPTPATTTTVRMGSGSGATPNTCIGPFVGTDTTVDFFTSGPEPKAELQSDVREVEYVLVSDPLGGQMLVRHVYTNVLPVVTPPPTPPDEVLCHGVVSFTLSYFDGANWVDAWDSVQQSDTLPVAVEVTLELSPRHGGGNTRLDRRIVPVACGTAASAAGGG